MCGNVLEDERVWVARCGEWAFSALSMHADGTPGEITLRWVVLNLTFGWMMNFYGEWRSCSSGCIGKSKKLIAIIFYLISRKFVN
jgi:hypothetical protein